MIEEVVREVLIAMIWRATWHAHVEQPTSHTTLTLNDLSDLGYSWTIQPFHHWAPMCLPTIDELISGDLSVFRARLAVLRAAVAVSACVVALHDQPTPPLAGCSTCAYCTDLLNQQKEMR